jgi:hypothetical protein
MKKLVLATVLSLSATAVLAGGVAEPAMQAEEVATQAASSQAGYVVPLLLLLALIVAASNNGGANPL